MLNLQSFLIFIAVGMLLGALINWLQSKYRYSQVLPMRAQASLKKQQYEITDAQFVMRESEMLFRYGPLTLHVAIALDADGKWQPYCQNQKGERRFLTPDQLDQLREEIRIKSFKLFKDELEQAA
jgi:hypothetical protein